MSDSLTDLARQFKAARSQRRPIADDDRPVAIYGLVDSSGTVRYIGKSVKLIDRLRSHRKNKLWMVDHVLLEWTDSSGWAERERFWIGHYRERYQGVITNATNGGDGVNGVIRSAEHHRKLVESRLATVQARGYLHAPETRELIRRKASGKTQTEATKRRRSESLKGHATSDRVRVMLAERNRSDKQRMACTRMLTLHGVTKPMAEWAKDRGLAYFTLRSRLNQYGWDIERALTTPPGKQGGTRRTLPDGSTA